MFCSKCGSPIPDNAKFCNICGTKNETAYAEFSPKEAVYNAAEPIPSFAQPRTEVRYEAPVVREVLPEQNRPLSPWAYWGLSILYTVPIVGFIFMIVFSFNSSNINRRNFTRSYWCWFIIVIVAFIILAATGATIGALDLDIF